MDLSRQKETLNNTQPGGPRLLLSFKLKYSLIHPAHSHPLHSHSSLHISASCSHSLHSHSPLSISHYLSLSLHLAPISCILLFILLSYYLSLAPYLILILFSSFLSLAPIPSNPSPSNSPLIIYLSCSHPQHSLSHYPPFKSLSRSHLLHSHSPLFISLSFAPIPYILILFLLSSYLSLAPIPCILILLSPSLSFISSVLLISFFLLLSTIQGPSLHLYPISFFRSVSCIIFSSVCKACLPNFLCINYTVHGKPVKMKWVLVTV